MKTHYLSLAALAAAMVVPGQAQAKAGDVQVKLLATLVAPDGKITDVKYDGLSLPAGTQSKANDNVTPTIAVEYFVTDNVSLETIAGVTQHDVDGAGALAGAELVSDVKIIPATLTLKYHFGRDGDSALCRRRPELFLLHRRKAGRDDARAGRDAAENQRQVRRRGAGRDRYSGE